MSAELPRHVHLLDAGRHWNTVTMGASSTPDADGQLDLLASFGD
jgi:hypothetical protein